MKQKLLNSILNEHSALVRDRVIKWVGNNASRFNELIKLTFDPSTSMQQRASWPLSFVTEEYPDLARPHLRKLLLNLQKKNLHVAVKRNTLRLFQFTGVPKKLEVKALDICYPLLKDNNETVAVRVFAMTVIADIAKQHPDLAKELKPVITGLIPYGSAGIRSRAKRILRELK